jgi:hemoglobin
MSSLYERLGAAAGIREMVEHAVEAFLENPAVAPRFRAITDLDQHKEMSRAFFCAGAQGPDPYTGRDMRTAHRGMNISEKEYLAVMDDIMAAADKRGVDDETRREVLSILYSLKNDIIGV